VAPEFYTVDFDKIWVLYTADEVPTSEIFPDGTFKDKDDRKHAARGVVGGLRRRNYKSDLLKPKKTKYQFATKDLESKDMEWMSVLVQEERRFVFLTAVKSFDTSVKKKKDRILTMVGYLFDTQKRLCAEIEERMNRNLPK
jgi:hypothetical protein